MGNGRARWRAPLTGTSVAALTVIALSCSDPSDPSGRALLDQALVDAFRPCVQDGLDRLVPNLEDETRSAALSSVLSGLDDHLATRDSGAVDRALRRSKEALRDYQTTSPARTGDGPDLSAVELCLDLPENFLESRP